MHLCVSQQQAFSPAQSQSDKDEEERAQRAGRDEVRQATAWQGPQQGGIEVWQRE